MNKRYSFLISILLTLFIFISLGFQKEDVFEETVIKRIVDGDTLVSFDDRTFRLANINSPEKNKFGYLKSIDFLSKLVNKTVKINSISLDNTGKREVVRLYYKNQYINLGLVELGLAPKAWVDESELKLFYLAEKIAVEQEKGIWTKSKYFGCLNISLNKEEEILHIQKICKNISLENYSIKDESREIYIIKKDFQYVEIKSGSFSSIEKQDNLFFWKEQNIWNNDRDTIYIFDSQNKIVYYSAYGYN